MSFCNDYDFELDSIAKFIEDRKARKIVLQLPEGLQTCVSLIIDFLRKKFGNEIEIYLSQNPSYGSCLVDDYSAAELSAEAIIHVGHLEYPLYKPKTPTLFVRGGYRKIDVERIKMLLNEICRESFKPICITTTAQHSMEIHNIVKNMQNCRFEFKGIILGCLLPETSDCGIDVVIAGGRFHCIAQALGNYARYGYLKTICIDPYINSIWNPKKDVEKILRVRLWKVREAFDAKNWLIIDGFYGQHRQQLINFLTNALKEHGKQYLVVKALKVDRSLLDNINAEKKFDAIVVVSCPYIAFDLTDYEKPVLTVGEALMAINKDLNRYMYPW